MKNKVIKKQKVRTEFRDISYISFKNLLDSIKLKGFTEKDYENIQFEIDYSGCYYEGDNGTIIAYIEK